MKLIEFKCAKCGAQIMPLHGMALYICDYCHSVNAVKYLTDDDLLSREERQKLRMEKRRDRYSKRYYALLFGGGLAPQVIVALHLLIAMPYYFTFSCVTLLDNMMILIHIALMAVSVILGLFCTSGLYYSCGYNKLVYNCTAAAIIGFLLFNMLINRGSIIHGTMLLSDTYQPAVIFIFIFILIAALGAYPARRILMHLGRSKKKQ